MNFDGKNDHNKLPLWMKTLFDTKAVDAWSEDPDYSQQSKGSDTTGKMKYTQRMFKRIIKIGEVPPYCIYWKP